MAACSPAEASSVWLGVPTGIVTNLVIGDDWLINVGTDKDLTNGRAEGGRQLRYKFRHTFATEYLRKNRHDIEGLRKILGHEDYKTLRNYVRLVREDLGDNWDGRVPFE